MAKTSVYRYQIDKTIPDQFFGQFTTTIGSYVTFREALDARPISDNVNHITYVIIKRRVG